MSESVESVLLEECLNNIRIQVFSLTPGGGLRLRGQGCSVTVTSVTDSQCARTRRAGRLDPVSYRHEAGALSATTMLLLGTPVFRRSLTLSCNIRGLANVAKVRAVSRRSTTRGR